MTITPAASTAMLMPATPLAFSTMKEAVIWLRSSLGTVGTGGSAAAAEDRRRQRPASGQVVTRAAAVVVSGAAPSQGRADSRDILTENEHEC